MNNNFKIDTDDVRISGNEQKEISSNFLESVAKIFSIIESVCASEWLGYSSTDYEATTNQYKAPMEDLGSQINDHALADIKNANNFDDLDQNLSQYMKTNL